MSTTNWDRWQEHEDGCYDTAKREQAVARFGEVTITLDHRDGVWYVLDRGQVVFISAELADVEEYLDRRDNGGKA